MTNEPSGRIGGSTIREAIDKAPLSSQGFLVLFLCATAGILDGYDFQALAFVVPIIAAAWRLPASAFGLALSASMAGVAVGGVTLAPLGDRYGRKLLIVAAMLLLGISSLAMARTNSIDELLIWRFITGLGVGISAPGFYALVSDYAPTKHRAKAVTILTCSVSAGALIGGFLAPAIIARYGWRGIFVFGGMVPVALAVILMLLLPESIQIVASRGDTLRLHRLLKRFSLDVNTDLPVAAPDASRRMSISALLSRRLRRPTLLIWASWCLISFVFYVMASWLPTMLVTVLGQRNALRVSGLVWGGGLLGSLLLAWILDRVAAKRRWLCLLIATAAASLLLTPVLPPDPILWGLLLGLIGMGVGGMLFIMPVWCALLYSRETLSTGVGWAAAFARIGAFLGPVIGGFLIAGRPPQLLLACLSLPLFVLIFLTLSLISELYPPKPPDRRASRTLPVSE